MAVQAGDILAFGRLAWDVYEYGFSEQANASRNYVEFGQDVRHLADSLSILSRVVEQATKTLHNQCGSGALVRWDALSLKEIVGDFEGTLRDCHELIQTNKRYLITTNPIRNLEWHSFIQPTADHLRQRIMLHNSKIQMMLKPFEIDLLSRVRQDINRAHQDLANRINAVHTDLHRLIGVLVPDLEQELRNQSEQRIYLLDIPQDVATRFRAAALADRPEHTDESSFQLEDLSDALVFNYQHSTKGFRGGGILISDRTPPLEQYLNLLKCIWLFQKLKNFVPNVTAESDSHWPSFVRQLEEDLSSECSRFIRDLVQPTLITISLRRDLFSIWPPREETQLVDVVTRDEIMEQVLEAPLRSASVNIERNIKLFRRVGSDGKLYRIVITGTEQIGLARPRQQTEVIDFDLASAIIQPQYAMPTNPGYNNEIFLQRDERMAKMSFVNLKDVLRFQQAVTGFKSWDSYCEYNVLVSFVVSGRKEPIVEKACVQLWIPKEMGGKLVSNAETLATTAQQGSPDSQRQHRGNSGTFPDLPSRPPMSIPQRPVRSPTVFSTSWPRQTSPVPMGHSPPPPSSPGLFSTSHSHMIAHKPLTTSQSTSASTRRSNTMATYTSSNLFPPPGNKAASASSGVSLAPSNNTSRSSGGESQTFSVSTGTYSTGFLHRPPPKPMLVLFTQDPKDGKVSFVSINIDEDTNVNPDRCDCRRAGPGGLSCRLSAIERRRGSANLEARRYESSRLRGDNDWNMARLALNTPASSADSETVWSGVKRISFMFPTPEGRARFSGKPNQCQCKNQNLGQLRHCLGQGHKGLWGEVQESYRRQVNEYHRVRYEGHLQIVNAPMG